MQIVRESDITITLPDGQTLSEIILTPWTEHNAFWDRIFNINIELYNDAGDIISSHFIQEFTDDTPYTGPGSNYGPPVYLFSVDNQKSWNTDAILDNNPRADDFKDSNGNYRTVLFQIISQPQDYTNPQELDKPYKISGIQEENVVYMKIDGEYKMFSDNNKLYLEQNDNIYFVYILLNGDSTKYYLNNTSTEFSTLSNDFVTSTSNARQFNITASIDNDNYESSILNNNATITIPQSKLFSLTDGSYNVFITVSNINDNDTSNNTSFIVDKTPPTIHDISFSWGDLLNINKSNNTGYIYVTTSDVVDNENITATIGSFTHTGTVLSNNATITIPSTTLQSLTDGNYDAVISANDINGNTGTNSASFRVDKIPPIINLMTLSWGSILNIEKASTVGYVSTIVSGVEDSQQITATLHGDQYTSYVYDGSANIEIPSSKLQSLSNTSYTLYATVFDLAGYSTTKSRTFTVDFIRPVIHDISFSWGSFLGITKSNSSGSINVTTSGVEDNQRITANLNNNNYDSNVINNSSIIIIPQEALQELVDGSYNVLISVTDFAENDISKNATFIVDKTPPVVHDISFSWGNYLNIEESDVSGYIHITTSGIEDGLQINVIFDNTGYFPIINNNSTTINIPSSKLQTLTNGNYDVFVSVTDLAGNNAIKSETFIVDKIAPNINQISFSWGQYLNNTKSNSTGSVYIVTNGVEDGQIATMTLNNNTYQSIINNNGSTIDISSSKLQELVDGSNEVIVVISDLAGNDVSKNEFFVVDRTNPIINSITFSWGDSINASEAINSGEIDITTVGIEDGQTITATIQTNNLFSTVYDNSATIIVGTNIINSLNDGLHIVSVNVSDIAGNNASLNKTFIKDTTFPSIVDISFSWGSILNINESISSGNIFITTSGIENNQVLRVNIDGSEFLNTVYNNFSNIVIPTTKLQSLVDGSYNVTINVSDVAGNSITETTSFLVDKTTPIIDDISFSWGPILNVTESLNDGVITISTSGVEDSQSLTLNLGNTNYTAIIIDNSAAVVINTNVLQSLVNGSYTVSVSLQDIAGNNIINTNTFVVDKSIPVIVLLGEPIIEHARGTTYNDPGATAKDSRGVDITSNLSSTSNVNFNNIGSYSVIYNVTDNFGNTALTRTRTVNVVNRYRIDDVETKTINMLRGYLYEFDLSDPTLVNHPLMFSSDPENLNIINNDEYQIIRNGSQGSSGASLTLLIPFTHTGPLYYFCQNHGNMGGRINVTENNDIVSIDENTPTGPYTITYNVVDEHGNNANTIVRDVVVSDTIPPTLLLDGSTNITLQKGNIFVEPGYNAFDFSNIDLTDQVSIESNLDIQNVGSYTITYTIVDDAGLSVALTRNITVIDTINPVITLIGDSVITHFKDAPFVDPGYTAIDFSNVNLIDDVIITGSVDNETIGQYTLFYNLSDSEGNQADERSRIVNVVLGELDPLTDATIQQAVDDWVTNPNGETFKNPFNEPYYGEINIWNVSQVTDMSSL